MSPARRNHVECYTRACSHPKGKTSPSSSPLRLASSSFKGGRGRGMGCYGSHRLRACSVAVTVNWASGIGGGGIAARSNLIMWLLFWLSSLTPMLVFHLLTNVLTRASSTGETGEGGGRSVCVRFRVARLRGLEFVKRSGGPLVTTTSRAGSAFNFSRRCRGARC